MSAWSKWLRWPAAVLGAVVVSVFVPVAARATTGTGEPVVEAARRRSPGVASVICCLAVVAGVVLLVLWLIRRRKGNAR